MTVAVNAGEVAPFGEKKERAGGFRCFQRPAFGTDVGHAVHNAEAAELLEEPGAAVREPFARLQPFQDFPARAVYPEHQGLQGEIGEKAARRGDQMAFSGELRIFHIDASES
jgi:hypothetical protein